MTTSYLQMLLAQANTDGWSEIFFGLDKGERFSLLIVSIGCGTGIIIAVTAIIAGIVGSVHRRRVETSLKREMIDRGMSADEIATIIASTSPPEDGVDS